jgi:hypothetical protein
MPKYLPKDLSMVEVVSEQRRYPKSNYLASQTKTYQTGEAEKANRKLAKQTKAAKKRGLQQVDQPEQSVRPKLPRTEDTTRSATAVTIPELLSNWRSAKARKL